jgi:uncharacterized protein (DUF58 family)
LSAWDLGLVSRVAGRHRLRLDPRRRLGLGGARLGAGPGASLEFHDHRSYQPGDDLRHVDWGVFARTDQLVLRRHRREVSPRLEVVLDASRSLALSPEKLALALSLSDLLLMLGEAEGSRPTLWILRDRAERVALSRRAWQRPLEELMPAGAAGLELDPAPRLGPRSERVLVSDGLTPGGGAQVLARLGRDAGSVALCQVLTSQEADPQPLGAVRLTDLEGGELDLVHDEAVRAAYRERFERHQAGWRDALRGRGPGLATCLVADGLEGAARRLVEIGLLEARAR